MSTATLLFCATWLRNVQRRSRAVRTDPPGFIPLPGRVRGRASRYGMAAVMLVLSCTLAGAASAQDARAASERIAPPVNAEAQAPVVGGAPAGVQPCVEVDIAGHRAGHLDCASQRLEAAARVAQSQARAAIDTPVIGAGSPDIQTGVASQSATRQRLGTNYGVSVRPQRPAPPAFSTPLGPRR